ESSLTAPPADFASEHDTASMAPTNNDVNTQILILINNCYISLSNTPIYGFAKLEIFKHILTYPAI
ncbi:hypothetical protein, partial [Muribaculum intestinale]|uniref:hypothetical protein n=1 Tax=Muribaculum intestinale TaxID=1796646 RepID=UPI0025B7521E